LKILKYVREINDCQEIVHPVAAGIPRSAAQHQEPFGKLIDAHAHSHSGSECKRHVEKPALGIFSRRPDRDRQDPGLSYPNNDQGS